MIIGDLLACLSEKSSFELRIFYDSSCSRIFTGNADNAVPAEMLGEQVKSWTTFWLKNPLDQKKPFYVLQIETFLKK